MKITKEIWERFAASNSKKRKKSATLRAVAAHVREVRAERAARKGGDTLGRIAPSQKLEIARLTKARFDEVQAVSDVRATLLRAAREARKMGFKVRSSKDKSGNVSSYYAARNGKTVRISDHCLPQTAKREAQADFHGGSAFAGEVIIAEKTSATRLRRLIAVAEGGKI